MKVLYLGIIRTDPAPTHEIVAEKKLDEYSRFTRGNIAEFMTVFAKIVAERTRTGHPQKIEEQGYIFWANARSEGICSLVITDHEYPANSAFSILRKIGDEFLTDNPRSTWASGRPRLPFPQLPKYLKDYQDPKQANQIAGIQQDLNEIKGIMVQNLDSILNRGEKLDDLVQKSEELSYSSKAFAAKSKDLNSCCVLM